jgi:hypothetical protein
MASVGSVGDAYDNALAESFVDSFKTELIADRVWRSRPQLELAVVEYVGWFNNSRLHESLGDIPPFEYEQDHAALRALTGASPGEQSVASLPAKAGEVLTTRRLVAVTTEIGRNGVGDRSPAPIATTLEALSGPQDRPLTARPAALSLRSPSGLAPRDGGGKHEPEGATTLTTKSTKPN